ncbi:MAG: hypothetical protein L3J39_13895 [Verrucomicrobiales bacterium]|nr:hypothetical protein [Verrucomicrobiales bacterium]
MSERLELHLGDDFEIFIEDAFSFMSFNFFMVNTLFCMHRAPHLPHYQLSHSSFASPRLERSEREPLLSPLGVEVDIKV